MKVRKKYVSAQLMRKGTLAHVTVHIRTCCKLTFAWLGMRWVVLGMASVDKCMLLWVYGCTDKYFMECEYFII
jgi:hypothetical protein